MVGSLPDKLSFVCEIPWIFFKFVTLMADYTLLPLFTKFLPYVNCFIDWNIQPEAINLYHRQQHCKTRPSSIHHWLSSTILPFIIIILSYDYHYIVICWSSCYHIIIKPKRPNTCYIFEKGGDSMISNMMFQSVILVACMMINDHSTPIYLINLIFLNHTPLFCFVYDYGLWSEDHSLNLSSA